MAAAAASASTSIAADTSLIRNTDETGSTVAVLSLEKFPSEKKNDLCDPHAFCRDCRKLTTTEHVERKIHDLFLARASAGYGCGKRQESICPAMEQLLASSRREEEKEEEEDIPGLVPGDSETKAEDVSPPADTV